MMNAQEFYANVEKTIGDYLPVEYANAEISLTTQVKHNDAERTGIAIHLPGENFTPIIYLDEYYRAYEQGGEMEDVLKEIADTRINNNLLPNEMKEPGFLADYDNVRGRLQMRAYDTEKNEKRLEGIVHHSFGDFSAAYAIVISNTPEHAIAAMVTPAMLEMWGITKKRLHDDTILSDLSREPVLMDMEEAMALAMGEEGGMNYLAQNTPVNHDKVEMSLFCLTNDERVNGAGLILNSVIQEKIAHILGGNYYVLPSSIHEVLILPDDGTMRASELGMMVRNINSSIVNPEDLLSDKVQIYDAGSKRLVNAAEYERNHEKTLPAMKAKAI